MTVRELINKLMNMDLDKPIYVTRITDKTNGNCVGFIDNNPITIAKEKIIDVDIHGIYGTFFNCITIQ